jgi:hypothetical protein
MSNVANGQLYAHLLEADSEAPSRTTRRVDGISQTKMQIASTFHGESENVTFVVRKTSNRQQEDKERLGLNSRCHH